MAASNSFTTSSAEETRAVGRALAKKLKAGDVLCLVGDVGAGKTTLVQGLAQGLGVKHPVQSPTFVLAHEYHGRITLVHMDFFRLAPREILSTGWEDYLSGPNALAVEWAEIGRSLWPSEFLEIQIERVTETDRAFTLTPQGARYEKLLKGSALHASARD